MDIYEKVSTGLRGFDQAIDGLRLGDNVVWQVDDVASYKKLVEPYIAQAKLDGRKLVYIRFGSHERVVEESEDIHTFHVDPQKGFESFATAIHFLIERQGRRAFYVFDCLTELLAYWHSDLMIGNFFKVSCPYLYELNTVAYFAVIRNVHTYRTIAGIRETTQVLFDVYDVNNHLYVHPLKVWNRYSPTMFFPHLIQGQEAVCITASSETAELFSTITRGEERLDYWNQLFANAKNVLSQAPEHQEETKRLLMSMLIGQGSSRMFELCDRYFSLSDILMIASREVGTGFIGGKSVGMLLARKILEKEGGERFNAYMEPHDSFYLGSDVFYTYVVQNGWWKLRTQQKTPEGYFQYAPELKEKLLNGRFPENIQEQFIHVLEYFGQSPIIVRSSSLLEDNFGNAFAGKYESVFCVNQGTLEERYDAFEQAIRTVYASTMSEDALSYRLNRGLAEQDEQMAILVQRVSGDHYGTDFFPHLAGVGTSTNLYVWDQSIDMEAGMLRLVFGLGTKAVDRTVGDYVRIICLDNPERLPLMNREDFKKFSQHNVDLLSLTTNSLTSRSMSQVIEYDLKVDRSLFVSPDYETERRLKELGHRISSRPYILDFNKVLKQSSFTTLMREMLALLSRVYDYPVDIEFTANFSREQDFKVNLLQCRPFQTRGLGQAVQFPDRKDTKDYFLAMNGNFMGGNVHLPIDYVVLVHTHAYMELSQQEKYAVARQIGLINTALKGKQVMLIGPGRWGTTTPSLGVPVHFSELSHMAMICEVSSQEAGFMPELSFGSHFFQDLVETGIFYAAIFEGQQDVVYQPQRIWNKENVLPSLLGEQSRFTDVIHIAETSGLEVFSDIISQKLICTY